MRIARIKLAGRGAVYHCVSRVVGRQFLLDDACKEMLVQLLWKLAAFYRLEVITYCMMDNHFHLLMRVPLPGEIADSELLERLAAFYGPKGAFTQIAREALSERGQIDADLRARIVGRMGDISIFMQEFKQRFSRWYNRRHQREGTLWSERFRSVIIEDQPTSVETVAAYIDLNPVRAGLVDDPKDYRFCGYAAALAGNRLARKGLMSIKNGVCQGGEASINLTKTKTDAVANALEIPCKNSGKGAGKPSLKLANIALISPSHSLLNPVAQNSPAKVSPALVTPGTSTLSAKHWTIWSVCASEYRMCLFARAGVAHQTGKTSLNPEKIRQVLQQGGQLSLGEICRLRLRHLTDGLAIGTQEYVNEVFALHRDKFCSKRQPGARPVQGLAGYGINSLKNIRFRISC